MGLIDDINKQGEESTYSPLTYESLKKTIEEALFPPSSQESDLKPIVLYTGFTGYIIFQLTMAGIGVPQVHWSFQDFERSNLLVLSLYEKSGLIKAYIRKGRLGTPMEIRKGTEVLKVAKNFDDLKEYLRDLGGEERKHFFTKKGIKKYYL